MFVPGQGEIKRLKSGCEKHPRFGKRSSHRSTAQWTLPAQDLAVEPRACGKRKVVLATVHRRDFADDRGKFASSSTAACNACPGLSPTRSDATRKRCASVSGHS